MSSPERSPRKTPHGGAGRSLVPIPIRTPRPESPPSLGTKVMSPTKQAFDPSPVPQPEFVDVDLDSSAPQVPATSSWGGLWQQTASAQNSTKVGIPARGPEPSSIWKSTASAQGTSKVGTPAREPEQPSMVNSLRRLVSLDREWSNTSTVVEPQVPEVGNGTERAQSNGTTSELPSEQTDSPNIPQVHCPEPNCIPADDKLWMVEGGLRPIGSLSVPTDTESSSSSIISGYAKAQVPDSSNTNATQLPSTFNLPPEAHDYGPTFQPTKSKRHKSAKRPSQLHVSDSTPQGIEVPPIIDTISEKRASRCCCAWLWSWCGA